MANALENSGAYLLPPPTGGVNYRDPWYDMPENDAIQLTNIYPDVNFCRLYGGLGDVFADISTAIHSLMVLGAADGTEKLVAAASGKLRDISAGGGGSGTDIIGVLTVGTSNIQYTVFRNTLFCVNGTDAPFDWTGSGSATATAWTGSGLTITNLINVASYKNRLYFVEKNTGKIWYTEAVNNISGALLKFDVSSVLSKGGGVLYAGPTTRGSSQANPDELFIIISDQGEILVYQGDNPLSSSWALVGRYFIGKPLGSYRCTFRVSGDLYVINWDGVISMTALFSGVDPFNDYSATSGKVRPLFNQTAALGTSGFHGVYHSGKGYILINDGNVAQQHGMNLINKSWFNVGILSAKTFAVFGNELYITAPGNSYVKKYDQEYGLGDSVSDKGILPVITQAYSFLGDRLSDKILTNVQPFISMLASSAGSGTETVSYGFDVDYVTKIATSLNSQPLSFSSTGSGVFNNDYLDASESGKAFAFRLSYDTNDPNAWTRSYRMRLYGTWVYFNRGAPIA